MCSQPITREQWAALDYLGPMDDGVDVIELRLHTCGTSLAIVVGPSPSAEPTLAEAVGAELTKSDPPPSTQPSRPPCDRLLLTLDLAFVPGVGVDPGAHKAAVLTALEAFRAAGYRPRVYRVQAAPARDPAVQHGVPA
jgi:hypothetical protein